MVTSFIEEFAKNIYEANEQAVALAKEILTEKVDITPYIVARFVALSGYRDLEVFIYHDGSSENPFNNEDEYEENIYYILYETEDIVNVTYSEFERLLKAFTEL